MGCGSEGCNFIKGDGNNKANHREVVEYIEIGRIYFNQEKARQFDNQSYRESRQNQNRQ